MSVISAEVEDNGWVLAIRGDWGPSGFGHFDLDPDGLPRVMLEVRSPGFDRIGGEAVANPLRRRVLIGTRPLRRVWPEQELIDEGADEAGIHMVRIALSNRVYGTDAIAGLTLAAGWRAGEEVVSFAGVINRSTRTAPLPIVRSAVPHMQMIEGPGGRIDLLVASHHPEHAGDGFNQAVAAVRLEATDGTRTNSLWLTGMSSSTAYADDLRCWGVDPVSSGLFAGLSNGVVTTHWTVYPWVGAARTSGAGHELSTATSVGHTVEAEQPVICAYDPGRTLWPKRYVVVDAARGATAAATVVVGSALTEARAAPAATVSVALQAIYLANVQIAAANGFAATGRSIGGVEIILAAGAQAWGTTAVSALSAFGPRLYVSGDPDDPDPRANVVLRAGSAVGSFSGGVRYWLQNLTLELGGSALMSPNGGARFHLHNCEVRGRAGFEGATNSIFNSQPPAGTFNITATATRWWKYGSGLDGATFRAGLLRNVESSRPAGGIVHVHCRKIADPLYPTQYDSFALWAPAADQMIWASEAYRNGGYLFRTAATGGSGTAADPNYLLRLAVVNCVAERSTTSTQRFFTFGEGANSEIRDSIFEGLTAVGNGINLHNEGSATANLAHAGTIFRNCFIDRNATKHDVFSRSALKTGSWEILYGVGYEGNINNNRIWTDPSNFQYEYYGLRSRVDTGYAGWNSNDFPKFETDLSAAGPQGANPPAATAGDGDYRPRAGSPAIGIAQVACVDVSLDGRRRTTRFHSGALQGDVVAEAAGVAPDDAAHATRADAAVISFEKVEADLRCASGRLAMTGTAAVTAIAPPADACLCAGVEREVRVLRVRPD